MSAKEIVAQHAPPQRRELVAIPACRRVNGNDLNELAGWLLDKILSRYPDKNPRAVMGWLQGCSESGEFFFVRCGDAIGLAQIKQDFLRPKSAHEVFVFAPPEKIDQAKAIYSDIAVWATHNGCDRLVVEVFTDVDHGDISLELGTPKRLPAFTVSLPLEG